MKRIISLLICLLLVAALPLSAAASQETKMIQDVDVDNYNLTVVCAAGTENAGSYLLQMEGQNVPVAESTIREEKIPVTVFCLVDTSGSISEFKLRVLQETLTEISNSMGERDNMVIATMSNDLKIGPILKTHQERLDAISGIAATNEDSNLYTGIVQSLDKLTSDESYNDYCSLVVLSDGMDYQDNGMTQQEVITAIEKARVPVFTVGLIQTLEERDGGKVLGSFSRASCGGKHLTTVGEGANKPIRWDMSGDEFGSLIWSSLQNMAVLSGDLSNVQLVPGLEDVRLEMSYTSGSEVYTDIVILDGAKLQHLVPVPEEPEAPWYIRLIKTPLFWIAVAAVLVLLGVVIFIILKKPKEEVQDELVIQDLDTATPSMDPGVTQNFEDIATTPLPKPEFATVTPDAVAKKRYKVTMTDIPHGKQNLTFTVNAMEAATFGRDPGRVKYVLSANDTQLSGKHFSMTLQDNYFCIRDENSKNGTMVNGVSIGKSSWVKFQSGDKIRAGAYEYRTTIEPDGGF